MAHQCTYPRCSATCTDCNEAQPMGATASRHNLDDLRRLRNEAMAAGPGSARWIKAAQALMDAFPDYYATAKAMNAERATQRAALQALVSALDHGDSLAVTEALTGAEAVLKA